MLFIDDVSSNVLEGVLPVAIEELLDLLDPTMDTEGTEGRFGVVVAIHNRIGQCILRLYIGVCVVR